MVIVIKTKQRSKSLKICKVKQKQKLFKWKTSHSLTVFIILEPIKILLGPLQNYWLNILRALILQLWTKPTY